MSEVDERALLLLLKGTELTAKSIAAAMKAATVTTMKAGSKTVKHYQQTGKQTLTNLTKSNQQVSLVSLEDKQDVKALQKELKRYKVDFSVVKDGEGKYQLLFKAKDAEIMSKAFEKVVKDFDGKNEKEGKKPSVNDLEPKTKDKTTDKGPDEPPKEPKESLKQDKSTENPSQAPKTDPQKQPPNKPLGVKQKLAKAKKEVAAFNQAVAKEKMQTKAPKMKGLEK